MSRQEIPGAGCCCFRCFIVAADRLTKWLASTRIELGNNMHGDSACLRHQPCGESGRGVQPVQRFEFAGAGALDAAVFLLLAAVAVLVALLKLGRKIDCDFGGAGADSRGALGNAYDRLRFGYVIDFLEVHIIHYHWPDFNVADSAIVVGGILLLLRCAVQRQGASPIRNYSRTDGNS